MKKLLPGVFYLFALVPQFVFTQYEWMVAAVFLIGFCSAFAFRSGQVFWPLFIMQVLLTGIAFFLLGDRVSYLGDVLANFGIPAFALPILFVLFNALNVPLIFLFGRNIPPLFKDFLWTSEASEDMNSSASS
ncbi:MAG: hypothetical protein AAFZ63_01105 [Bacteroidota bacterium]